VQEILSALADQMDELDGIVAGLDDAGWQAPSACEGWTVSDVLLHLAQTNELAVASLEDRLAEVAARLGAGAPRTADVDEAAAVMVEHERGAAGPEVLQRWREGVAALQAGLEGGDLHRRVTWVAGELSARTLATTRLAETWIHTGDVAAAFGNPPSASDRLWHIARLAWRTLPYAFARDGRELTGSVAFELRPPGGGEDWTFAPDGGAATTIRGDALDLCLVAARRVPAADTGLTADGPDADAVLELVRTFA
jgi:uncharacterized protein (TIGR03084 family)